AAALAALPITWASLSERRRIRESAALLESAVLLLPEVAPRHLVRTDQQRRLGDFAGLACDAAAWALADVRRRQSRAQPGAGAAALRGRGGGILLGGGRAPRGGLTELRRVRPDLADRYCRLRDLLDRPPAEAATLPAPGALGGLAAIAEPDHSQLARDFTR